ncbi:replication initiation protein [Sediminitomix flava]|uniref:Replication initiator protein n=1 Tax=Sediminitomix flava TaxID=379075 RepID=A0A315YY53_SEDFL|nr:replication initiation protein [Sediminitomix flava]PWJ34993.1 replication initiator protein [Sediminitomix flava]
MKFVKRKKLVRKSNKLINAKENTPLTALERKLMLYSVSEVNDEGKVNFRIQDLYGTSKLNTSHYRNVRKAVENLLNVKVVVEEGDVSDEDWRIKGMNVFDVIEASRKGGSISARFTQSMIPHITNLKRNYTTYLYEAVSPFRSDFSIRIYELLVQGVDHYSKREFELEELKSKIGISQIKTYTNFNQIRTKVLDKACHEITEKSDIDVTWDISGKKGRRVSHITFFMQRKTASVERSTSDSTKVEVKVDKQLEQQMNTMKGLGLSEDQIRLVLQMKQSEEKLKDVEPEVVESTTLFNEQEGEPFKLEQTSIHLDIVVEERKSRLRERLIGYKVAPELVEKVVEHTQASKESGIWKHVTYLQKNPNAVDNPAGYLTSIFRNNYGL